MKSRGGVIQTSFCDAGHEVWWGWFEGERVPFVRVTYGYELVAAEDGVALPLRHCFRRHEDICRATRFTPPHLNGKQELRSQGQKG